MADTLSTMSEEDKTGEDERIERTEKLLKTFSVLDHESPDMEYLKGLHTSIR